MSENIGSTPDPFIEDQYTNEVMNNHAGELAPPASEVPLDPALQPENQTPFASPNPSEMFGADHETATQVAAEAAALTEEAINDEAVRLTPASKKEFRLNSAGQNTGNQIISTTKIKQARENVSTQPLENNNQTLEDAAVVYNKAVELAQSQLASPESKVEINPWEKVPNAEIQPVLSGVFLGNKKLLNGNGYVDEYYQPVHDAGIEFGVEQASYGFTGISARTISKDLKVEALKEDKDTKAISWVQSDESGEVRVTGDWGKLGEVSIEDQANVNLGKEGGRAGIVRVTDKTGNQRFYVMGADFKGEPDNWKVTAQMVEVYPKNMPALTAQKLGLPSGDEALSTREKHGLNAVSADETPLKKAQKLYAAQSNKGDYSYFISGDDETDTSIEALTPEDRERYNQWKMDRAKS